MKFSIIIISAFLSFASIASTPTEYTVVVSDNGNIQYSQTLLIDRSNVAIPHVSKQYSYPTGKNKVVDWALYFIVNNQTEFTLSMSSKQCGIVSYEGILAYGGYDILTSTGCNVSVRVSLD